jgi:hypothetical protein
MAAITFPARESADDAADAASSSGDADGKTASEAQSAFRQYLKDTRNTICGRHPIGVLLGALSALEEAHGQQAECRFTRYEVSRASSAAPPALTRPAAKLAVPACERQQRLVRQRRRALSVGRRERGGIPCSSRRLRVIYRSSPVV